MPDAMYMLQSLMNPLITVLKLFFVLDEDLNIL